MSIVDKFYVKHWITNNQTKAKSHTGEDVTFYKPVPYRWTHGATDYHLGDGLLIYSLIQYMRAKICVCLGSGGGFIPRIMSRARWELHDQELFTGNNDLNWGDIGATFIVDAANEVGGVTDWTEPDSFFRSNFYPRVIIDTTENAFHNFFVKEDIKIDYLHIDADHSYEGVKKDFELYTSILSPNAIVSIHDTDKRYQDNYVVTKDISDQNHYREFANGPVQLIEELGDEWQRFDLFNEGVYPTKPSSTGLTLLRKRG